MCQQQNAMLMDKPLVFLPATEILAKIKARPLTVVQVATAFLDQIAQHNPTLNAVIDLRSREEVLAEARAKDEALERGEAVGRLHGLPMTVKDSFLVQGLKNSNGDPMLRHYVAEEDAELVRRLKQEGAIILGKTNCPLFCIDWQSTNFWNGQTNNPYDLGRVSGGSSGGSAVAVSAGSRVRFCAVTVTAPDWSLENGFSRWRSSQTTLTSRLVRTF